MKKFPEHISDSFLVVQYKNGDNAALAVLVKRWHSKFCKQAFWYTKDADIAKDIAQESWNAIISKIKTLKETEKFGGWALTIVVRKSIDWLKSQKREQQQLKQLFVNTTETERNLSNKSEVSSVLTAILSLPEHHQVVLRLFYIEQYKLHEIAELLKLSKGTVKSRLFYAREKLKTIIKNRNYE